MAANTCTEPGRAPGPKVNLQPPPDRPALQVRRISRLTLGGGYGGSGAAPASASSKVTRVWAGAGPPVEEAIAVRSGWHWSIPPDGPDAGLRRAATALAQPSGALSRSSHEPGAGRGRPTSSSRVNWLGCRRSTRETCPSHSRNPRPGRKPPAGFRWRPDHPGATSRTGTPLADSVQLDPAGPAARRVRGPVRKRDPRLASCSAEPLQIRRGTPAPEPRLGDRLQRHSPAHRRRRIRGPFRVVLRRP
jgi:hypothetical protein